MAPASRTFGITLKQLKIPCSGSFSSHQSCRGCIHRKPDSSGNDTEHRKRERDRIELTRSALWLRFALQQYRLNFIFWWRWPLVALPGGEMERWRYDWMGLYDCFYIAESTKWNVLLSTVNLWWSAWWADPGELLYYYTRRWIDSTCAFPSLRLLLYLVSRRQL